MEGRVSCWPVPSHSSASIVSLFIYNYTYSFHVSLSLHLCWILPSSLGMSFSKPCLPWFSNRNFLALSSPLPQHSAPSEEPAPSVWSVSSGAGFFFQLGHHLLEGRAVHSVTAEVSRLLGDVGAISNRCRCFPTPHPGRGYQGRWSKLRSYRLDLSEMGSVGWLQTPGPGMSQPIRGGVDIWGFVSI